MDFASSISDLSQADLARFVPTVIRRIVLHNGIWFSEVLHQLGLEEALAIEDKVASALVPIVTKRIGGALRNKTNSGDSFYAMMTSSELTELIEALSISWLASDGVWFQTVENQHDMYISKRCNDICWMRFSPLEANIIRSFLGLPKQAGVEGLRRALGFRLYASINEQTTDVQDGTLFFHMIKCRVQDARKRKGLPDYPCKSAGLVEYSSFASTIDPGIRTECLACPPDEHPVNWACAWKFNIKE